MYIHLYTLNYSAFFLLKLEQNITLVFKEYKFDELELLSIKEK